MKKVSKLSNKLKYTAPKISLAEAVKEYEIEISKNNLTVIDQIRDILDSGVESVSIVKGKKGIEVKGDYKTIQCQNVKVEKINGKSYFDNITQCKLHIECSTWCFPSPDYKYSNIKRNLEKAISSILGIYEVKVKSFSTGIVEYDTNE